MPAVLHAVTAGAGPRLVLVHGFTQDGRCWGQVAAGLAAGHEVVLVDAPGHGRSAAVTAGLEEGAALLGATGGPAAYLGYSMGGRLCLTLALARPDLVRALVLVGATAGIEDPVERAARRERDEALAARLEAVGVPAFVDEWLAQPLFAGLPAEAAFAAERREGTVAGLAASLRTAGTGAQEPSWHRLHELAMPVLVVAGERDARFAALGRRLAAAVGANATFATVPGAGHAAHLEAPAPFLDVVLPWLADHHG
jgi:2-succinyl-6-hydroxy-2,4-cyclohexadiene-1-carboxylate synthase